MKSAWISSSKNQQRKDATSCKESNYNNKKQQQNTQNTLFLGTDKALGMETRLETNNEPKPCTIFQQQQRPSPQTSIYNNSERYFEQNHNIKNNSTQIVIFNLSEPSSYLKCFDWKILRDSFWRLQRFTETTSKHKSTKNLRENGKNNRGTAEKTIRTQRWLLVQLERDYSSSVRYRED